MITHNAFPGLRPVFVCTNRTSPVLSPCVQLGSRHSSELKGGAAVIAKMAGVPLVPAIYQGPLTFKQLFSRKRVTVAFGAPIVIDRKMKLDEEGQAVIEKQMQAAFDKLDKEIDPNFHYVDVSAEKKAK